MRLALPAMSDDKHPRGYLPKSRHTTCSVFATFGARAHDTARLDAGQVFVVSKFARGATSWEQYSAIPRLPADREAEQIVFVLPQQA